MNILLVGSGGREHALAWKMKQSSLCDQLWIAPGNAGTAAIGNNVPLSPLDFPALGQFVLENSIGGTAIPFLADRAHLGRASPREPRCHEVGGGVAEGSVWIGERCRRAAGLAFDAFGAPDHFVIELRGIEA